MKILPAALLLIAPAYSVSVKHRVKAYLAQQDGDMGDYLDDLKYDVVGDNVQDSSEYHTHEETTEVVGDGEDGDDYIDHSYPEYDYGELTDMDGHNKHNCYETHKSCDGVCPDKHIEIRYIYVPGESGVQGP